MTEWVVVSVVDAMSDEESVDAVTLRANCGATTAPAVACYGIACMMRSACASPLMRVAATTADPSTEEVAWKKDTGTRCTTPR